MRRVRYSVAMSLDGYIAGPKGEYDWIPMDPDIDFAALVKDYDTITAGYAGAGAARRPRSRGRSGSRQACWRSRDATPSPLPGGGASGLPRDRPLPCRRGRA